MTSTPLSTDGATDASGRTAVALRFEATVLPVADDDRAKAFYVGLGWRLDADFPINDGYRIVQVTPPGSECSVIFGDGLTQQEAGTLRVLIGKHHHGGAGIDHHRDGPAVDVGLGIEVTVPLRLDLDDAIAVGRSGGGRRRSASARLGDILRRRQAEHLLGACLQDVEVRDCGDGDDGDDAPTDRFAQ